MLYGHDKALIIYFITLNEECYTCNYKYNVHSSFNVINKGYSFLSDGTICLMVRKVSNLAYISSKILYD